MFKRRDFMAFILIAVFAMVISQAFISCGGSSEPNIPEPPSNLWYSFGDDNLEIILHWQQSSSSDIDGYNVYFENELIASVSADSMTFSDYPEKTGTYSIAAYSAGSISQRIHKTMLDVWVDDLTMYSRGFNTLILDTLGYWLLRKSNIVYSGWDINYGDSTNEYMADSIDFYFDSLCYISSPYRIVEEGRWSHAFHTRFMLVSSGITAEVFDTFSVIPIYDDSDYVSSIQVNTGDLIAFAAFRDNEPALSADKIYALAYIGEIVDTDSTETMEFSFKLQPEQNYRFVWSE